MITQTQQHEPPAPVQQLIERDSNDMINDVVPAALNSILYHFRI